jgi:DNA-binding transcriptional ArsR family regulator
MTPQQQKQPTEEGGQVGACAVLDDATLAILAAAADRYRMQVLMLLGEQGRCCVGTIAGQFSISRPAISHHLKVLKTAGLVEAEKVGQEIYYSVNITGLVELLRGLADTLERCCQPAR